MTLIELVNRLRILLRSGEARGALSLADEETATEVGLINDAAEEVFSEHSWEFLKWHDGQAFFPGKYEVAIVLSLQNGLNGVSLEATAPSNALTTQGNSFRARLVVPSASQFPDVAYTVASINTTGLFSLTLDNKYRGPTSANSDNATIFCHEAVLPATVREVLSIRQSEGASVRFRTVHRTMDFDEWYPELGDEFSDYTRDVAVGDSLPITRVDGETAVRNLGIAIYPPADTGVILDYSYVRRHARLAAETDEFAGIPSEAEEYIVHKAYELALSSNIESDPRMATFVARRNEGRLARLKQRDLVDAGRRRVPTPFGKYGRRHDRVEYREIPEP